MAKLTLSVDEDVVQRAKRYAARRGTSVSRLVERYLQLISRPPRLDVEDLPPVLARLRGVLKSSRLDETDYRRYLEKKYR
jgi:hypothetical protein